MNKNLPCMFMALVTLVEAAFSPDKESRSDAPRLFAPGIVSTQDFEYGLSMSPDGRTVYFTRGDAGFNRLTILESRLIGRQWARPKVAPFSGIWKDADAQVSPDGGTIMFISTRPMAGSDVPRKDYNIWFVRRTRRGWSEPEPLDGTINTDGNEASPSMTRDGTLYFEAVRKGHAGIHVYRSQLAGGHYQEPELLGFASSANDINPIVSADGRFIIFSSRDRGGAGGGDLFITFAQSGGSWSTPRNLGEPINSKFGELSPGLSPDNQTLYFSSNRIDGPLVRVRRPTFDGLERELHRPQNGLLDVYEVRLGNLQRFKGP